MNTYGGYRVGLFIGGGAIDMKKKTFKKLSALSNKLSGKVLQKAQEKIAKTTKPKA
ncbi:MAG: hypothetical protein NUW37_06355 [Planctomycetes bacterium]|nr:hypothetical protein [Planctomycetota bacterium]